MEHGWLLIKARISADNIGRYIGYDKSISAYRLSVKFHRYANPNYKPSNDFLRDADIFKYQYSVSDIPVPNF